MPHKDRSKFNSYRNKWAQDRTKKFHEFKSVPCADCGGIFPPYVMDFDHRPDEVKLFTVGNKRQFGWERILAEIAKCDVVCANCHRIRTHNRASLAQ